MVMGKHPDFIPICTKEQTGCDRRTEFSSVLMPTMGSKL
jgi:hypothetical protein